MHQGQALGQPLLGQRKQAPLDCRFGQWCSSIGEESSINRELRNLVEAVTELVGSKGLEGAEIFLFTDNSTAEGAFWKGNSRSRKLFELILDLEKLEWAHGLVIHVVHVSGKRMIAQGTDGLSRADFIEGVMSGRSMGSFVPLHLTVRQRSPELVDWVLGWLSDSPRVPSPVEVEPKDWYLKGHQNGTHVWAPAPAAADVVVEQLGKARHKRPNNLHVVVVPRLMTGRWRRALSRLSDFYFRVPIGSCVWSHEMFEPALIFVVMPLQPHRPWSLGKRPLMDDLVRMLLKDGVWGKGGGHVGSVLRKFLLSTSSLWSMSPGLVTDVIRRILRTTLG